MSKTWEKPVINILEVGETTNINLINLIPSSNKPEENPGCTTLCHPGKGIYDPGCPVHGNKASGLPDIDLDFSVDYYS